MQSWIIYVIIATIIYGIMNFVYKIVAEKNIPVSFIVHISAFTVFVISFSANIFMNNLDMISDKVFKYACYNGSFFALGSLFKITALKKAPASTVFPVNKLNAIFVILIGFFYFNEIPNLIQIIAIILAVTMIAIMSLDKKKLEVKFSKTYFWGILFALLAAISTSASMTIGKRAAEETDKLQYLMLSYFLVCIFTGIIFRYKNKSISYIKSISNIKNLRVGITIGILNCIGYYLLLKSYETGPLSLTQTIFSSSIIIPIVLSLIIYKEKLSLKKIIAIILSLISVSLIKISK